MSSHPRGLGYRGPRPTPPLPAQPFHALHAERVFATSGNEAPPSCDNSDMIDFILDQGRLGACVANAAAQAIRMRQVAQHAAAPILPSRLAGYYLARAEDGTVNEDAGTYVHSYFDTVAKKVGFASEAAWPYIDDLDTDFGVLEKMRAKPDAAYIRLAFDQRDKTETSYHAVTTDQAKAVLAAGYPIVLGCQVDARFVAGRTGRTEVLAPPSKDIAGGHSMLIVGYAGDTFKVCNSWSAGWGDAGYCYFSRAYVEACDELFAVEHVAVSGVPS